MLPLNTSLDNSIIKACRQVLSLHERLSIVDTTCISQSQIETSKGMMGSEATVCTNVDNGNLMCLFLGIQLHMQYGLLAQWLRNHSSFHH